MRAISPESHPDYFDQIRTDFFSLPPWRRETYATNPFFEFGASARSLALECDEVAAEGDEEDFIATCWTTNLIDVVNAHIDSLRPPK